MYEMNMSAFNKKPVFDESLQWILCMLIGAVILGFCKSGSMILLTRVAEKIVQGVRKDLYKAILRKNIGWHDNRENSSGVMTATLSSDVQLLNGVSSDGIAVMLESAVALLFGVAFALYWSWPMALCCIGIIPIIMTSIGIVTKANNANMLGIEELESDDSKSSDIKQSQILATDSISNYKTVASFGND